jgi:hypothetical protein
VSNKVDRGWRGLTTLKCDTPESYAIRKTCKYHQHNAVRDAQLYLDAKIVEKVGDDVRMKYRDRYFLIDVKGDKVHEK